MSSPWTSWPPPTPPTSSQVKNLSAVLGATVTDALNALSGAVTALTSSNIANASAVSGATVTDALNNLIARIVALTSSLIMNASSVAGGTVTDALNALAAAINALNTSAIANVSTVTGATATLALNALNTTLASLSATVSALNTTSIANVSTVTGATTTAALNTLKSSKSARDAIWDPPTVASGIDFEGNVDVLLSGAWNIGLAGSPGTPLTRDGDFDLSQAVASGHYRSKVIGGDTLYVQIRQNEEVLIWRTIDAAQSTNCVYFMGCGFQTETGSGNTVDPRIGLMMCRQSGSAPDLGNRVLIRTGSNTDHYELVQVTGGTPSTVATNTLQLATCDGFALRVNHGSAAAGNAGAFAFTREGTINTVLVTNSLQFNANTDKVVIDLQMNTAQAPAGAINNAVFAWHFLRRIDLSAGLWIAQS